MYERYLEAQAASRQEIPQAFAREHLAPVFTPAGVLIGGTPIAEPESDIEWRRR